MTIHNHFIGGGGAACCSQFFLRGLARCITFSASHVAAAVEWYFRRHAEELA